MHRVTRRALAYPGSGALVHIPRGLWLQSLEELRAYGAQGSEGLLFWGGVPSGESVQVTGLYLPGHSLQGERVRLTPDESRWLLRRLRARDEKLVAQVHSHRYWPEHSLGDDQLAPVRHDGFLSIVIPNYGSGVTGLEQCGTYEAVDGRFVGLDRLMVRARFCLSPTAERPTPRNEREGLDGYDGGFDE